MYDIRYVKRRFFALNTDRLHRTQHSLRMKHRDFLKLLPLFFHVNHPLLPGYVSAATPTGISNYTPPKSSLLAARRLSKSFAFKRRAYPKYDIYSIFLTGSSGTIAYTDKSDFDVWVCHDPRLDALQRHELRAKADAIEQWAHGQGLEVHIFTFDEIEFRQSRHGEVNNDSSGSAQHHLLLEEFYRTGLLLAGRYPVWWLVPPEMELQYDEVVNDLLHKRFIRNNESVDLGGIGIIPAEEFFGASLWQLSKGIESPYKSILKIQLMESYVHDYPENKLLSTRFKEFVYSDDKDLNNVDPYIMMCNHIEDYLKSHNEYDRLELMRRCLYFKSSLKLSKSSAKKDEWRYEAMAGLAHKWRWDDAYIHMLDTRDSWKITQVQNEKNLLVNELTHSYRLLSAFAKQHADTNLINQLDMTKLGRKLYAHFERKKGKIEVINPDISANLYEDMLTFVQVFTRGQEVWSLFRGNVVSADLTHETPLKQTQTLIELVAWAYFNTLISKTTRLNLRSSNALTLRELKEIIQTFPQVYENINAFDTDLENYNDTSYPISSTLFVNIGIDPLHKLSMKGQHLISERTDAFNYSGLSENLVLTFDMVTITNWKEIICKRYTGVSGIMACLTGYIRDCVGRGMHQIPQLRAFSFSSTLSATITRRVNELFAEISGFYHQNDQQLDKRYVIEVDHVYYVIQMSQQAPYYQRVPSYNDLLDLLAYPQRAFSEVRFDHYIDQTSLLPVIYTNQEEGKISVYYLRDQHDAHVYIVDEKGSLFTQTLAFYTHEALLNQLDRFLSGVIKRLCIMQSNPLLGSPVSDIAFYKLIKNQKNSYEAVQQRFSPLMQRNTYYNVEAVLESSDSGNTYYSLYCDDIEFSALQYGSQIYDRVAEHIVSQRQNNASYPIYITDLDISGVLQHSKYYDGLQTVHFLDHKLHIEALLNNALMRLTEKDQQVF